MKTSSEREGAPEPDARTERDVELDLEVALEVEGYRWVEWNHQAIGETALDEPGRFVGHPGDLLAHLYVEAAPDLPLADRAYARLPRYSLEPAPALRVAERAGVFAGEGVVIACSAAGTWRLAVERVELQAEDDCLPRLLSRAALRLARRSSGEGAR